MEIEITDVIQRTSLDEYTTTGTSTLDKVPPQNDTGSLINQNLLISINRWCCTSKFKVTGVLAISGEPNDYFYQIFILEDMIWKIKTYNNI